MVTVTYLLLLSPAFVDKNRICDCLYWVNTWNFVRKMLTECVFVSYFELIKDR